MFSNTRKDRDQATRERRRFSYANVMATVSVFMVLAGGTALAATTLTPNSVTSKTVKDNKLKSVDLKDGKAVSGVDVIDASLTGTDVADDSISGADVNEASLAGVLKADPDWQAAYKASHANGTLVKKSTTQFLSPTDYSPIK